MSQMKLAENNYRWHSFPTTAVSIAPQ